MPDEPNFRRTVFERMRAALGEPEVSMVRDGEVYRWTLRRRMDLNFYVTLDSPEHLNLAHIMLSDGSRYQSNRSSPWSSSRSKKRTNSFAGS
ncbi:MAG: hypothetical protein L6Q35_12420 [Phycisphaerales bacterium]|nr:hypothetical protein [Phycisphaerales bacterium]